MRLLITLLILAAVFAAWAYYDVDSLNRAIESVIGVKTLSLDDMREMAERGEIPWEVYRLALYKKLQNPKLIFKVSNGIVYEFPGGLALQGKYFERVNESWLRVGVVQYDEERRDYAIVTVDVSEEPIYPYRATGASTSYLHDHVLERHIGKWRYTSKLHNLGGVLYVDIAKNPNPEDWRIADEIAAQLLAYAKKHEMTKSQIAEMFYSETIRQILPYPINDPYWWERPWDVLVLNNYSLEEVTINESDSLMKSILLHNGGECFAYAYASELVLNSMGIKAVDLIIFIPGSEGSKTPHSIVALSADDIDANELKYHPRGVFVTKYNRTTTYWYPIDPPDPNAPTFETVTINVVYLNHYIKG